MPIKRSNWRRIRSIMRLEGTHLPDMQTMVRKKWLRSNFLQLSGMNSFPELIVKELNVTHLQLKDNSFHSIPDNFADLNQLTHLHIDLSRNLKDLPSLDNLTNLEYLSITGNWNLKHFPPLNLPSLTYLDLRSNRLVDPPLGNLPQLVTLILADNLFYNTSFDNLALSHRLQTLNLNHTSIYEIPSSILSLSLLRNLDLGENPLLLDQEHNRLFSSELKLEELNLSGNRIDDLPPSIANQPNLIRLSLDNNALTSLPDELFQLTRLERLNLTNNQLTRISPKIVNLQRLIFLDVSYNQLSYLPEEIVKLRSLVRARFDSNQFPDPKHYSEHMKRVRDELSRIRVTGL